MSEGCHKKHVESDTKEDLLLKVVFFPHNVMIYFKSISNFDVESKQSY